MTGFFKKENSGEPNDLSSKQLAADSQGPGSRLPGDNRLVKSLPKAQRGRNGGRVLRPGWKLWRKLWRKVEEAAVGSS